MGGKSIVHALMCCSKAYYDNSDAYPDWDPKEHTADRQQIHHGDTEAQRSPVSPILLPFSSGGVARIWHRAIIVSNPFRPGWHDRPAPNSRNTRSGRVPEHGIKRAIPFLSVPQCLRGEFHVQSTYSGEEPIFFARGYPAGLPAVLVQASRRVTVRLNTGAADRQNAGPV